MVLKKIPKISIVNEKVEAKIVELQKKVKSILIENGFDKKFIIIDPPNKTEGGYGLDDVRIVDSKKQPQIIINIEHPSMYSSKYWFEEISSADLLSLRFDYPNQHLMNFDGDKFTYLHRLDFGTNHGFSFRVDLNPDEVKELKNISPNELMEKHRIKHKHPAFGKTEIESDFFPKDSLMDNGITPFEFFKMLVVKHTDEIKNGGKLFGSHKEINEQLFYEFKQDVQYVEKLERENNLNFESCIKYFKTSIGIRLKYCSISDSNPFELIKLISPRGVHEERRVQPTVSKEIMGFISQIQDIKKNSTIVLDNLSFSSVFEHLFVIIEKLECKLEDHHKFVKLFIINKDQNEIQKIKFLFRVLGINTDNIKSDFSELKNQTRINYQISLKPFNQRFSVTSHNEKNVLLHKKDPRYGNDVSKYEIIDRINNVKSGTIMSFIVSSNTLFEETKSAKLFRNELLENTKVLAIIQLPRKSIPVIGIEASLIILKKSKDKISDYDIFMSYIDKTDVDFLFTEKAIVKKYNEFTNNNKLKNENDFGFLVNSAELKENWSVTKRMPSQKKILSQLKFSNPVSISQVAEIIRPTKHSKLNSIIKIADMDGFLEVLMSGDQRKSEKNSENTPTISIFEPGDILFSISGTIGKTAKIIKRIPNIGLSRGILIIRPNKSKVNPDYLKHVLDSNNTRLQIQPKQSIIPYLGINQLKDIKIELHSLKKQRDIIKKIKNLENEILKLKTMIQKCESTIEQITTTEKNE